MVIRGNRPGLQSLPVESLREQLRAVDESRFAPAAETWARTFVLSTGLPSPGFAPAPGAKIDGVPTPCLGGTSRHGSPQRCRRRMPLMIERLCSDRPSTNFFQARLIAGPSNTPFCFGQIASAQAATKKRICVNPRSRVNRHCRSQTLRNKPGCNSSFVQSSLAHRLQ